MKNHRLFQIIPYVFVVAIFISLISPYLLTHGMFMDGTIYAVISRNLAIGEGSFWSLKFMSDIFNPFYEHPPLAIYFESLFFRVFGDQFWVEKGYSVLITMISGFLIHLIWNKLVKIKMVKPSPSWIPMLFWVMFPLVTWSSVNNMLENTMAVFVLFAFLLLLISVETKKWGYIILSGFSLFLAFLSKGPIGLYLWSFYLIFFLIYRSISFNRVIVNTLILLVSTLFPILVLYFVSPFGFESLGNYLSNQVVRSVSSVTTVNSRLFIVISLLNQLLLPLVVLLVWSLVSWFITKKNVLKNISYKGFLFLFIIGLTGVLPIMVSLKQSGFYILTTFPFFAISIAAIAVQFPKIEIPKWLKMISAIFSVLLFCSAIGYSVSLYNTFGRDKNKIQDINTIKKYNSTIHEMTLHRNLWSDWGLIAYASRYAHIDIYREENPTKYFLLREKGEYTLGTDTIYQLAPVELINFDLFERKRPTDK